MAQIELSPEVRRAVVSARRRLRKRALDPTKYELLGFNRYRVMRKQKPIVIFLGKGKYFGPVD